MNMQYMEAFAEIEVILKFMPKELLDKIPLSFRNLISNKKAVAYKVNIKSNIPLENQELKKETKSILSLIYRSYLISSHEKEKLELADIQELERVEKEIREKYNPDYIFQKKNEKVLLKDVINELPIDYSNLRWYRRFYHKILKLFKFKE